MVLSCAIDAKEGRYVVMMDIPGAFLHADMEDEVHMLLEGTIAELIVKLELSLYRKHIWYKQKGNKGTIQYTTGSAFVLETTIQYITGVGFHDQ